MFKWWKSVNLCSVVWCWWFFLSSFFFDFSTLLFFVVHLFNFALMQTWENVLHLFDFILDLRFCCCFLFTSAFSMKNECLIFVRRFVKHTQRKIMTQINSLKPTKWRPLKISSKINWSLGQTQTRTKKYFRRRNALILKIKKHTNRKKINKISTYVVVGSGDVVVVDICSFIDVLNSPKSNFFKKKLNYKFHTIDLVSKLLSEF